MTTNKNTPTTTTKFNPIKGLDEKVSGGDLDLENPVLGELNLPKRVGGVVADKDVVHSSMHHLHEKSEATKDWLDGLREQQVSHSLTFADVQGEAVYNYLLGRKPKRITISLPTANKQLVNLVEGADPDRVMFSTESNNRIVDVLGIDPYAHDPNWFNTGKQLHNAILVDVSRLIDSILVSGYHPLATYKVQQGGSRYWIKIVFSLQSEKREGTVTAKKAVERMRPILATAPFGVQVWINPQVDLDSEFKKNTEVNDSNLWSAVTINFSNRREGSPVLSTFSVELQDDDSLSYKMTTVE